ncbi:2-oxoglutarate-dependent dioxygenase AOP3-like [Dioscorea cayenensis subsp. rotundata]|uniref:2-oxoglutarate-dependent dioxygenase AOP3-like n=1 Tax=Dioscorea cayennensis subsp. rotundata TaxID=55577 RepID=A0AB40CLH8_DIOCR|nr:2-oxoglutarate-dependent dioxygenase AOP3-like [Dioscorea cayenensis subsp. rotundata]
MESMAVFDATADGFHSFTNLMWPQGHPYFCETMQCYVEKLMELDQIIHRMIMKKFGVEKHYDNLMKHTKNDLRMSSYDCTGRNEDEKYQQAEQEKPILFPIHTDPNLLTIILQDQVGVEVQIKSGEWVRPSLSSFVVFPSESYEAWTNGRLEATKHRVVNSGNGQIRYSAILASTPVDGFDIQTPQELIDEEHPALYKPFEFSKLFHFRFTEAGKNADSVVKAFCGIQESKCE